MTKFQYQVCSQDKDFLSISCSKEFSFPAYLLYRVLADYSYNYYRVLPRFTIKYVVIMKGGKGMGTEFRVLTSNFIGKSHFDFVVDEPDLGRVITLKSREEDILVSYKIDSGEEVSKLNVNLLIPHRRDSGILAYWYKRLFSTILIYSHIKLIKRLLASKTKMLLVIPPYFATGS